MALPWWLADLFFHRQGAAAAGNFVLSKKISQNASIEGFKLLGSTEYPVAAIWRQQHANGGDDFP